MQTKGWRRVENYDKRVAPDSTTPFSALTPEEVKVRVHALNLQRKSAAATIERLKAKIEWFMVELEMNVEMKDFLEESLEHALKNKQELYKDIESTLLELLKEDASKSGSGSVDNLLTHEDTKQLVEFIAESMRNHIHKVNGHKNRYRFSPYLTGLAMGQFGQTGKSRYDQWCNDMVVVMPASGGLSKKRQAQKVCAGDCIVMYEKRLLVRQENGDYPEEVGEIICDEMKLQEDILINVKTNKMVGFTEDFICKKKILNNLLDEDKIDNFCEPAKEVNQWRYRSNSGSSMNIQFFFNGGSLDGDTLLEQFNQVVIHCEMIGARVVGFVCDAGGGNARLMSLLRGKLKIPDEVGWLPENIIRTPNPYAPDRYIYLFHCSTHGLKAMRGQLFSSWTPDGSKQFLDEYGNKIGKGIIEEACHREMQREMNNVAPKGEVRESTVQLNSWSKMNVKHAKNVFSEKTLAEIADHLYDQLSVPMKDRLKRKRDQIGFGLL